MRLIVSLLVALVLTTGVAVPADPMLIGVVGGLSGPNAERGQQEQDAVELALAAINAAGGVLGRPVEAIYGNSASAAGSKPELGIAALHRLLDQRHVTVVLGAGATPVTHAIMPVVQAAQVPLIIDISAGQDFVDASGVGGNPFAFKTIPSDLDIARTNVAWLRTQGAQKVAIVADDLAFNTTGAASYARAAGEMHVAVADNETIPKGTTDLAPLVGKLKALGVDHVILLLGPSTAAFFRAYEALGWNVPVSGRVDLGTAIGSVSPAFLGNGGLAGHERCGIHAAFHATGRAAIRLGLLQQIRHRTDAALVLRVRVDLFGRRRNSPSQIRYGGGDRSGAQNVDDAVAPRRVVCNGQPQPSPHADANPRRPRRQDRRRYER